MKITWHSPCPGAYDALADGHPTDLQIDRAAWGNVDTGLNSNRPLWIVSLWATTSTGARTTLDLHRATTLRDAKRWVAEQAAAGDLPTRHPLREAREAL